MNFAVLQQFATPDEIYNRPVNLFVANFIGSPTMNFFKGGYKDGEIALDDFPGGKISLSAQYKKKVGGLLKNRDVVLGLRPEHLKMVDSGADMMTLKAKVVGYEPLGSETVVYLEAAGSENIIKSIMDSDYRTGLNETHVIGFREENLYLFDAKTEELVLKF
jgi:multiple sugar transport system ATP-binding protein